VEDVHHPQLHTGEDVETLVSRGLVDDPGVRTTERAERALPRRLAHERSELLSEGLLDGPSGERVVEEQGSGRVVRRRDGVRERLVASLALELVGLAAAALLGAVAASVGGVALTADGAAATAAVPGGPVNDRLR